MSSDQESVLHEDCVTLINELNSRREQYECPTLRELEIPEDCRIYRAVNKIDKKNTTEPDSKCFSGKGLSVYIQGTNLPVFDLEKEFEQWKTKGYLGVWEVPKELFPEAEFRIRHDPFPYTIGPEKYEQTPNHAQIFCHKSRGKGREIVEKGKWAIPPE